MMSPKLVICPYGCGAELEQGHPTEQEHKDWHIKRGDPRIGARYREGSSLDPNVAYKQDFRALTEKLGRVPTPRDKEWLELTERLRKSYLPAEEEKWTSTPTTTTSTRAEAVLPATSSVDSQTKSATGTEVSASTTDSATYATSESQSRPSSHAYAQTTRTTTNAREGAGEALSGPGIITEGVGGPDSLSAPTSPSRIDDGAMVGSRGPSGGIYAKCDGCGQVWERERRRGRPSAMCGECK